MGLLYFGSIFISSIVACSHCDVLCIEKSTPKIKVQVKMSVSFSQMATSTSDRSSKNDTKFDAVDDSSPWTQMIESKDASRERTRRIEHFLYAKPAPTENQVNQMWRDIQLKWARQQPWWYCHDHRGE